MVREHTISSGDLVIVDRAPDDGPGRRGVSALEEALGDEVDVETATYWADVEGVPLVVGTTADRAIRRLVGDTVDPDRSEGVVIGRYETPDGQVLVAGGTDGVGLQYAALELTRRIELNGITALDEVDSVATVSEPDELVEYPDNEVRGVDRFLANPDEDQWFYDDDFWQYYLDRLARNRFNRLVLITGYDTAFMSPPYPFFVDVPGYEEVTVGDGVEATAEEHLAQLRRVGQLCHDRGIELVFGTWQQRPRSVNPHLGDTDQEFLVENVPTDDDAFTEFCARGLEAFLVACPEIDAIQLRVNMESGIGDRSTAETFWREMIDAVERADNRRSRPIGLEPRAKGCTNRMIRWGLETNLDVTLPTKFWCESTGLPYHQTQMRESELANLDDLNKRRRYGYADLLEEPRSYDVLYRLWSYGTNRLFVWGDPDYARRFGDATQFGDARGFEVMAPLSMKGGRFFLRDPWPLFDDESLRQDEYEDERYWAWYLLFGRFGYNTNTDIEVWRRELRERFGDAAEELADAYRHASSVLPLITAVHLTDHPANYNWTEMDTGGALFAEHNVNDTFEYRTYMYAEPSDPGLFYGIDEYVADVLDGETDRRYTPGQIAHLYDELAAATEQALDAADDKIDAVSDESATAEYRATRADLRCIADLAAYHASKTRAALAVAAADETGDDQQYALARTHMQAARERWRALADRAEAVYGDDVLFGRDPTTSGRGSWSDALDEIDADLDRLAELAPDNGESDPAPIVPETVGRELPFRRTLDVSVPARVSPGTPIGVSVRPGGLTDLTGFQLHYRRADQTEGEFETVSMTDEGSVHRAAVPGEYVEPGLDLLLYVTAVDESGDPIREPGLAHPTESAPYHVVEVVDSTDGD